MGCGIAFDVGTTAVKTMVFNRHFVVEGSVSVEYRLLAPEKGCLEVDSDCYWEAAKECMRSLRKQLGERLKQVDFVTVTTQGETLIPICAAGRPLRNAIVWLDGRAEEESAFLKERVEKTHFYQVTGIPECTPAVPVCKLMWIKRNEPELYRNTAWFLLVGDYMLYRLTGRVCTERTLMSTTGYYDIRQSCLWQEMLDIAGIDRNKIPEILETGERAGEICEEAARELELPLHTAVFACTMDQVACAVGAGNVEDGVVTENAGTCLILAMTAQKAALRPGGNLAFYQHALPGKYLAMTNCPTAGIILKWFKDEFCEREAAIAAEQGTSVYNTLGNLAAGVEPMSRGLILLPHFSGVLQPECAPGARGVFFGVTLETGKAQFVRCIMESVGFLLRENLEYLEAEQGIGVKEIRSLGGAAKSRIWEQIKADIVQRDMVHMKEAECTALGAAMIVSVTAGWYEKLEHACNAGNSEVERISFSLENRVAYETGYEKYRNLYRLLKDEF